MFKVVVPKTLSHPLYVQGDFRAPGEVLEGACTIEVATMWAHSRAELLFFEDGALTPVSSADVIARVQAEFSATEDAAPPPTETTNDPGSLYTLNEGDTFPTFNQGNAALLTFLAGYGVSAEDATAAGSSFTERWNHYRGAFDIGE